MGSSISMAKVFDMVGYDPHQVQRSYHAAGAHARFRAMCAGRRMGKSFAGGHELTPNAFRAHKMQGLLDPHGRRMEYWIVGPEYSDAEKEFRVVYNDLKRLEFEFDKPGTYYDANGGNMHISLFGGRFLIHAKSAKYPETLVGEGLDGVLMVEAAKIRESVWPKYIRPTLIDKRGWAGMTSTPEGKNWFYDEFMKGLDPDLPEYWSIRAPSYMNDRLFPLGELDPEFLSLIAGLSESKLKQEILAEFNEFVGRVFKRFDEGIHCVNMAPNPKLETYACVDFGWTNPFVFLLVQVDVWDNVYVVGEYYEKHKRIDEAADEIIDQGLNPSYLRAIYPDPEDPQAAASLANRLGVPVRGNTGGELDTRLDLIRKWLEVPKELRHLDFGHPERKPKLFIDPKRCPNLVREMGLYRYPETNDEDKRDPTEKPLKKDDHAPEALGRFFAGHYGEREAPKKAKVRKSTLAGRR